MMLTRLVCGLALMSGCNSGGSPGAPAADPLVDRIVQAVAERREVMVKVKLEVRPGAGKEERRTRVAGIDFDEQGATKTFHLKDGAVLFNLPSAAFRSALVRTAPVTIDGKAAP